MDCLEDSFCWTYSFPELPPPPPIPNFLSEDVEAFLNHSRGLAGLSPGCDLCSWAGASASFGEVTESNSLPLSSLLVIVAVVSALTGAGLTAAVLSFRRLRNRKLSNGSDSVRHLSRKINDPSRPLPPASSFTSNTLTENTYCEGPYNDKEQNSPNNIYAELHTGIPGVWNRPPVVPPVQNCYLELKDLPNRCRRCLPPVPNHWQSTENSPSSSAYYSDLDLARHSAQPI
ncbi:unnamed protein product [Allacma fusca]|uniref:Uncharacterized protein n=1 Tax=Allacma fusca TaxID=39272 RepID=A0A8J2LG99_9HEXA|nr:unnamed protein product [Allacma fusca]